MADIRQTNRSAIFTVINPEKPDFLTLSGDTRGLDGLDDTLVQEIEDALLVKDYAEFERKFQPVVYSYFDANSQTAKYTLERPDSLPAEYVTEIPLGIRNPTTGMMYTMLDSKAAAPPTFPPAAFLSPMSVCPTISRLKRLMKMAIPILAATI